MKNMEGDFVDKLWRMAYSLHGTLGVPESCRFVIYALFIRYIDLEKSGGRAGELKSYDERFSVSYLALTYGKIVKAESVVEYVEQIEKDLMLGDGLISAEMKELLEKLDDSQVQAVFAQVDEIGVVSREQLYETASLLLEKLSYMHGNLRSEISANLSLCKLEGRLLDCGEGMKVYDGFSGYGLSASETACGRGIVYLQDRDKSAVAVACVIALLKGNRVGAVKCGDSLTEPMSLEKYDRVVCEPPFVSRYENGYCEAIPEGNCLYPELSDDASIALRHAIAHMEDNGIAVVLVPRTIFVNYKSACIRTKLEETYLDAVIELPEGASPNAGAVANLLVLKKDGRRKNIFWMNAKDFFGKGDRGRPVISDDDIDRLVEIYKKREASGDCFVVVSEKTAENSHDLYELRDIILNPKDAVVVGDIAACMEECRRLAEQLAAVDSRLETLRGRFVDGI